MKFYRIIDMTLRKYDGEQVEYKVGTYGTLGGVTTDLNECANIIEKEKKKFSIYSSYGTVTILKDETLEFQAREIYRDSDYGDSETIYSIKVVEIDVNINN